MQSSKSDYMLYLKHPAWLWIKKHAKTILPPIDAATQAMFDAGKKALLPKLVVFGKFW